MNADTIKHLPPELVSLLGGITKYLNSDQQEHLDSCKECRIAFMAEGMWRDIFKAEADYIEPGEDCLDGSTQAAFVDGNLEGEEFEKARDHICECEYCRRAVADVYKFTQKRKPHTGVIPANRWRETDAGSVKYEPELEIGFELYPESDMPLETESVQGESFPPLILHLSADDDISVELNPKRRSDGRLDLNCQFRRGSAPIEDATVTLTRGEGEDMAAKTGPTGKLRTPIGPFEDGVFSLSFRVPIDEVDEGRWLGVKINALNIPLDWAELAESSPDVPAASTTRITVTNSEDISLERKIIPLSLAQRRLLWEEEAPEEKAALEKAAQSFTGIDLRVGAPSGTPITLDLNLDPEEGIRTELSAMRDEDGDIDVRCVVFDSDEPAPEVEISFSSSKMSEPRVCTTDSAGMAAVQKLSPGDLQIALRRKVSEERSVCYEFVVPIQGIFAAESQADERSQHGQRKHEVDDEAEGGRIMQSGVLGIWRQSISLDPDKSEWLMLIAVPRASGLAIPTPCENYRFGSLAFVYHQTW